jgi:hypothetical protein
LTLLRKFALGRCGVDQKSMAVTAILSTPAEDTDGDVIESLGIDTKSHARNPVVLWNHQQNLPPVARAELAGIGYTVTKSADGLRGTSVFSSKVAFSSELFALYSDDILRAWSVGVDLRGGETHRRKSSAGRDGLLIKRCSLREYSAVAVGANSDALTVKLQKGFGLKDKFKEQLLIAALSPFAIAPTAWSNGWTPEAEPMSDETPTDAVEKSAEAVETPPALDADGLASAVADKLGATFAAKVADLEVSKANLSAECDILRKQLVAAQNDSAAARVELAGVRSEADALRKQLNAEGAAAAKLKAASEQLAHEFYRLTGRKVA